MSDYEERMIDIGNEVVEALTSITSKTLTTREQIAAMALQGIVANHETDGSFEAIAGDAVRYADDLLAKLKETK
jgi:hypothetical protein